MSQPRAAELSETPNPIQFTQGRLRASWGSLTLYSAQPWRGGDGPVVVILHGAARSAMHLRHLADHLMDLADVVLVDLPGHGRSDPLPSPTLDALATNVLEAIRLGLAGRPVLLVGESLGGLVALVIAGMDQAGMVKSVFAADPPVTSRKLRNVATTLRRKILREPTNQFLVDLVFEVFGISDEEVEERIYYPVLGALKTPALIATGDFPMTAAPRPNDTPCLFDAVDCFIAREFYGDKVEVREIPNAGHLLLIDKVGPCVAMIRELLAAHVARPGGASGS